MEVHFTERLWNYLKLSFIYMAKRSLVKRGKLLSKTLLKLMLHHQNHHFKSKKQLYPTPLTLRDYEFSCSSSPNPALIKVRAQIYKSSLFSCFNGGSNNDCEYYFSRTRVYEPTKCLESPYVLRASAYGSDEEEEDEDDIGFEIDVDYRAEKFIESFYEQLRAQSHGNNFILRGVDEYI